MKERQLTIRSQTEHLHTVRAFVTEAALSFGFDDESTGKIALAVDEACTNIIKHAYEFAPNKTIDILVHTNRTNFEVIIRHQGKPFDPETIKPPDMKEYLTHYRHGGLGMHLMRSLLDRVEYKALPDNTTEIRLVKVLPARVQS